MGPQRAFPVGHKWHPYLRVYVKSLPVIRAGHPGASSIFESPGAGNSPSNGGSPIIKRTLHFALLCAFRDDLVKPSRRDRTLLGVGSSTPWPFRSGGSPALFSCGKTHWAALTQTRESVVPSTNMKWGSIRRTQMRAASPNCCASSHVKGYNPDASVATIFWRDKWLPFTTSSRAPRAWFDALPPARDANTVFVNRRMDIVPELLRLLDRHPRIDSLGQKGCPTVSRQRG